MSQRVVSALRAAAAVLQGATALDRSGPRYNTYFYGKNDGTWTATTKPVMGFRSAWDWEMTPSVSSRNEKRNFSVEGATEQNRGFLKALRSVVSEYPEVADFVIQFDGPFRPVAEILSLDEGDTDWSRTTFLHGTSSSVLDLIQVAGLRPRSETNVGPAYGHGTSAKPGHPDRVYLTTQQQMASFAATHAATVHGGEPIILEIRGIDPSRLEPDEDSNSDTAEESIGSMGSCAYRGSIPPKLIVRVLRREGGSWR